MRIKEPIYRLPKHSFMKGKFPRVPNTNMIGKDSDKDGVINGIDCYPHNKKMQGPIHSLKKYVKGKYEQYKADRMSEREARAKVREGNIKSKKDIEKYYSYDSKAARAAKEKLFEKKAMETRESIAEAQRLKRIREQERMKYKKTSSSGIGMGLGGSIFGDSSFEMSKKKKGKSGGLFNF